MATDSAYYADAVRVEQPSRALQKGINGTLFGRMKDLHSCTDCHVPVQTVRPENKQINR